MAQPNVLLICVDHWPGTLLGSMGHRRILTPTLDNLAANGVLFTQAYSAAPTCIPARRTLMTGTTARTHGDRVMRGGEPLNPAWVTLPQAFRNAGYQAHAVGKLHVHPARSRIGFDDVILNEEGRGRTSGFTDDYEMFLKRSGLSGQDFTHGMGSNDYSVRPWHLPEPYHPTYWTTREMCQTILRRDPTRPAFWYCSYTTPHPPITPLSEYLDTYRHLGTDDPVIGPWARKPEALPYALKMHAQSRKVWSDLEASEARKGFYAQCTYIDHQIRLLIGTLREEGILKDTVVLFTGDHGDMLGNHGLWAKSLMLEGSAKVPMILVPNADDRRIGQHRVDGRLVELRDVMPTLLDLCGLPIPASVEGQSMVGAQEPRAHLYGEHNEGEEATRMIRAGAYKLIWYPAGNRIQLFNLEADPQELHDLAQEAKEQATRERLIPLLIGHLYGEDLQWVKDGKLTGCPEPEFRPKLKRGLNNQRGWR